MNRGGDVELEPSVWPVERKLCFDSGATGVRRVEPETRLQVVYGEQLLSTCHANRTYVSTQGIPLCA